MCALQQTKHPDRIIVHVDMDAFYAAIEQRENPSLKGRAVVVGGRPDSRGVVAAASYEARAHGVRSAMPCAMAYRLCPNAVFLSPRFTLYKRVSRHVMGILKRYTATIEPLSLDEAFLDLSGRAKSFSAAKNLVKELLVTIHNESGLTASAGIAPNKFLAKVASDLNKPFGLYLISPEKVDAFLLSLPVRKIPGVGKVAEEKLLALGMHTLQDLRTAGKENVERHFGKFGSVLWQFAHGHDSRPVEVNAQRRSLAVEQTFTQDLIYDYEKHEALDELTRELVKRISSQQDFKPSTLSLKVKLANFQTFTRSTSLLGINLTNWNAISAHAKGLLDRSPGARENVRLLGISTQQPTSTPCDTSASQLELRFPETGRESAERAQQTITQQWQAESD